MNNNKIQSIYCRLCDYKTNYIVANILNLKYNFKSVRIIRTILNLICYSYYILCTERKKIDLIKKALRDNDYRLLLKTTIHY